MQHRKRRDSTALEKVIAYSNHRWEGIEKKNIEVIPRVYIHWMGTPAASDPEQQT